jgi:hypothetical protein
MLLDGPIGLEIQLRAPVLRVDRRTPDDDQASRRIEDVEQLRGAGDRDGLEDPIIAPARDVGGGVDDRTNTAELRGRRCVRAQIPLRVVDAVRAIRRTSDRQHISSSADETAGDGPTYETGRAGHRDPHPSPTLTRLPREAAGRLVRVGTTGGLDSPAATLCPDDLRHAAATFLLAQGFTLEDVKNLLGHSSIVLTSNTYGHVLEQRQEQVASGMDAVLSGVRT